MKVPYYKAKIKNSEMFTRGFIFAFPSTTYCIKNENRHVPNKVYLASWRTGDWGLPNEPILENVDLSTLEQIGWFNTDTEKFEDM